MADFEIPAKERRALAAAAKRNPLLKIRRVICDWLWANGITPADVPITSVPAIADGRISTDVYLRRDGRLYLDENREAAKTRITVALLVEPPDVLKPWLAGKLSADSESHP